MGSFMAMSKYLTLRAKSDSLRMKSGCSDNIMDEQLERLIDLASSRGSTYVKGTATIEQLPEKLAEMGVFLLEKSTTIRKARDEGLRQELIEIQNKVDDMRRTLFANKLLLK
jgi:hypothetical protein